MIDKHLDIYVFGKVQGVFFRSTAKEVAERLGVKGYTKNEGKFLYIEAEGNEEDLDNFIEWCHQGPDLAKVERVDFKEGRLKGFKDFNIL